MPAPGRANAHDPGWVIADDEEHDIGVHAWRTRSWVGLAPDPGATWADLGQAEFTATPTSHVYRSKGEHTARLDVTYVAEYRFDGSAWRWIDGTLTIEGAPQRVLVGEFDTVLVTGPCTTHPDSPGCG